MASSLEFTGFRINTPRIVHETIDGETIIIDFDNGSYFSLEGSGAAVWDLLVQNVSVEDTIATLIQRFPGNAAAIKPAVEQFLSELQREELIVPVEDARSKPAAASNETVSGAVFTTPTINKFTDMQDLLLLDPIHEVNEQGWPMRKDEQAE
jgi:hypothetical protein